MTTNALAVITTGTHFFKITKISFSLKSVITEFAKRFVVYRFNKDYRGQTTRTATAVYGAATHDRDEYRFHINQLEGFIDFLERRNYSRSNFIFVKKEVPVGVSYDLQTLPQWVERDYQIPVIDHIVKDEGPVPRIVKIHTGRGKTFSSLRAITQLGKRFAVLIRPQYIEKWKDDICKYTDITRDEILEVKGGKNLQLLTMMGTYGQLDRFKAIIISNKTYQFWLKDYERFKEESLGLGYTCLPEDFYETIGCGIRLVDEVHLDLHLQFKADLYTNVSRSIALSGSFESRDSFIREIMRIMYPPNASYEGGEYVRYVTSTAAFFYFHDPEKIKTVERGGNMYSHHAVEKSIRRDPFLLANYLRVIDDILYEFYFKECKPGEKFAVYAQSIEMCSIIRNHLAKNHPTMNIQRFVEDDPEENLYHSDAVVTTIQSGGTAHDIDRLKLVFVTNAIDSIQSNIQVFGRLRDLPGVLTRFVYLTAGNIPKQMDYHNNKKPMVLSRSKAYNEYLVPIKV